MDGKTRSRKACDVCSIRKVKCDESGPPCRSCTALDIPCTYNRPSRRRGPPNKHAESLKKQKLEADTSPRDTSTTMPLPAPHQSILNSYPGTDPVALTLSGESICPLPTLQQLVDDFFTFIHPLIPIPHEPTFRAAFARREDVTNKRFLALLAAMVGNLAASFPRRPKLHLRSEVERNMYPHSMALVKRCHDVAVEARGAGYLDTSNTVDDAAISYHLGLCAGYVYNIRRCRLYFGECMTILRIHNLYKPPTSASVMSSTSASPSPGSGDPFANTTAPPADVIVQELARRLFYVCLVGFQTMHQLGSTDGRIYVPPETPTDRYPQLPREVDDEYILPTHIDPQPPGIVSQLTGFNANVRIFQCYNPLAALEIAFGTNEVILGWERQRNLIWECLQKTKTIIADLPPELAIHNSQVQEPSPLTSWSFPQGVGGGGGGIDVVAQERRRIQDEIQKANIYISQLSTRSYLVDKYWSLYEGHSRLQNKTTTATTTTSSSQMPSPETYGAPVKNESETSDADFHAQTDYIGQMMREERGLVIKDLLCLLRSVKEIHIEPNGASFTYKVRQIASTLLNLPNGPDNTFNNEAAATTGPQPISTAEAEDYLRTFLDILVRLEGVGVAGAGSASNPGDGGGGASSSLPSPETHPRAMSYGSSSKQEETEERRQWANFKDFQNSFLENGGHLYSV